MIPKCQTCGTEMRSKRISTGNAAGIAKALLFFALGVLLFVCMPIIGWIIGPIICICALFMGGHRQNVWRCPGCRAIVPRI